MKCRGLIKRYIECEHCLNCDASIEDTCSWSHERTFEFGLGCREKDCKRDYRGAISKEQFLENWHRTPIAYRTGQGLAWTLWDYQYRGLVTS